MTPKERKEAAEVAAKWVRQGKLKFAPPIIIGKITKQRALWKAQGLTAEGRVPKRRTTDHGPRTTEDGGQSTENE